MLVRVAAERYSDLGAGTCDLSRVTDGGCVEGTRACSGDILKAGSSTDLQSFKFGEFKDPNSYLPSPFILYKGVFRGALAQGTIELDNLCSSFTASAKPSSASTTLFDYLL